jgi:ribosome recycling factor
MIKEILKDADRRMKGAIEVLHEDFKHLRTGRASTQMLDGVSVDYYGTPTPVSQVGSMHVPDPAMIVIQPWEPKMLPLIEKAIMNADLGLNPTNDGKVIRVPVPALTEERRREISKKAHDMAEHARTAVRQVRRDANDKLKKLEKDHEISQDDEKRALDDVQKLTDQHVEEINESLKKKEAELMEV